MTRHDLIQGLGADADSAGRAALELFESRDAAERMADAAISAAVRASVAEGNHNAAALLLLGYDSSTEAAELLSGLRDSAAGSLTKLQPWTQLVPAALVADIALSRQGDGEARNRLLESIETGELATLTFLVSVLREIDASELLQALARSLDDEREVSGGVPSGATPARRLADDAVDAFVERLGLDVGFSLDSARRYTSAEAGEVKSRILGSIPQ